MLFGRETGIRLPGSKPDTVVEAAPITTAISKAQPEPVAVIAVQVAAFGHLDERREPVDHQPRPPT